MCSLLCVYILFLLDTEVKKINIEGDIRDIKESIKLIFSLTKDTKIPLGLQKALNESFMCLMCTKMPIAPPIIVGKCCKHILGCQECVNRWYSGPDALQKACPYCQTERGYTETMQLTGIDEFLTAVKNLQAVEVSEDDDPVP